MRKSWPLGVAVLIAVVGACAFLYWDSLESGTVPRLNAEGATGRNEHPPNGRGPKATSAGNTPDGNNASSGTGHPDQPKSNTPSSTANDPPPEHPQRATRFREAGLAEPPTFGVLPGWAEAGQVNIQSTKVSKGGDGMFADTDRKKWLARLSEFSPTDPDGALDIDLCVQNFDGTMADGAALSLTVIRTRDSAAWSIECPSADKGFLRVLIPVAEGDQFRLQVTSGDSSTALAHIPCAMISSSNQLDQPVYDLYRRGRVRLEIRLVPRDANPQARPLLITDGQGRPLKDAVVLCEAQELGRSGADGVIRWPLMPVRLLPSGLPLDKPKVRDLCYVVHAPGYVPIMLTRSEVEQTDQGTLSVVMRAPEFVATVYGSVSDERCLYLGARYYTGGSYIRESQILRANWDLLPLRPEMTVKDWPTAYRELLRYNQTEEQWAHFHRFTKNHPGHDPFSNQRMHPRVKPFSRGEPDDFHRSWADGLEAALEQPYHPFWPDVYGGWYFRRWRYKDGRFDVALPYPGKFLLLVGEEFRENATHSLMGQINHILYIDATDQDNVKGELFRCPG